MAQRSLLVQVVRRFRGLNRYTSLTNVGPDWARDLLNVIVGSDGGLHKMRLPLSIRDVQAFVAAGGALPANYKPYSRLFDHQQGDGTRYLLVALAAEIVSVAPPWTGTISFAGPGGNTGFVADFITLNNITFIATPNFPGLGMWRWIPTGRNAFVVTSWCPLRPTQNCTPALNGAGALTFVNGGRRYAISFSDSTTGIETSLGPLSATTGNCANNQFTVTTDLIPRRPTDYDTVNLYATLDGGQLFYYDQSLGTPPLGGGGGPVALVFNDNILDSALDQTRPGSFINEPPPDGHFLGKWGGRAFVFNLIGAPQDIVYSGYERILVGRPEAAFPPQNRLRLALGADAIAGGGAIQAGIVAFSRSAKMYMYRGIPEDVVTNEPLLFSAYLEELPWEIGCMCHQTIASTPYGLIWLASDKTVMVYDGTNQPVCISAPIHPLMKQIDIAQAFQCRGGYYNWLDREWYVLSVPLNGNATNNAIFFFDLEPDPDLNAGVFYSDIQADDINVIEDANGNRHLMILQNGVLMDLQAEMSVDGGITLAPRAATGGNLTAYYESALFGNENPQQKKMFRYARYIADAAGFTLTAKLVDDEAHTVAAPLQLVNIAMRVGGKFTVNRKAKRCGYKLNFPAVDADANVVQMLSYAIPTSEK